mgnify:CR=1 FL=1
MKQNVLIIGAGLSGLVTAKTLLEYGYPVTVFEKEAEIGGVWAPSRRYPGLTTQNTRDTYAFSDFRMPRDYPEFPSGEQMQAYLKAYAAHFQVIPVIRLNHTVENAVLENDGKGFRWTIAGKAGSQPFEAKGDFLIICNGTFSEPAIPSIPGMEAFTRQGGAILHTSTAGAPGPYAGKRVAVVGFGKSACDLAAAIAGETEHTYLIYRQTKWKVPKRILGINYKYFILTRFGEALTKLRYRNTAERLLHALGIPKRIFGFMQRIFSKQQQLDASGLRPDKPITDMLYGELSVESDGFYQNVRDQKITAIRGEISAFHPGGVTVPGAGDLALDTVIFGTGFHQNLPFLPKILKDQLTDSDGNYLLYRNILPVRVPALAFVGYNSSFFCNLTSEIAALWLCEYLEKRIDLPAPADMEKQIREHLAWRQQFRQNALYKNASVYPFNLTYVDWLLKDMHARLPLGALLSEWLVVVEPGNYAGVKRNIMRHANIAAR